MGAPPTPMYATFYFAIKEYSMIQKYLQFVLFYGRYIDDTILIVDEEKFTPAIYHSLQEEFNSYGTLQWTFTSLQDSLNFLDVTTSI